MPPIFVSKADLIATPVEIPGLVPSNNPVPLGYPSGSQNFDLGSIERILMQLNSLVGNGAQLMQNVQNARIQAAQLQGGVPANSPPQQPRQLPPPRYETPPVQPAPQQAPQIAKEEPKEPLKLTPNLPPNAVLVPPMLNEEGAKQALEKLIVMIEEANPQTKGLSLGMVAMAYRSMPEQKATLETQMLKFLNENIGDLVVKK